MPYRDASEFAGLTIEHDPNEPMHRARRPTSDWSLRRILLAVNSSLVSLLDLTVGGTRKTGARSA